MKLDKIITLANSKVKLRFLAMERSLRKTGCELPLWVIPYDDDTFDLPPNATWWKMDEIISWLNECKAHPTMRKYQCLTVSNYQFVDSDVVFLRNPEKVLERADGFVTSCGHWTNPGHTYTAQSLEILKQKSTLWQKNVFNTGQYACDKSLYTVPELMSKVASEKFRDTCLTFPYHEQPGINLLVNTADVLINNLTLPPYRMESTWAGDYTASGYESKWNDANRPYLIHWAGCTSPLPIDELFFNYLSSQEKQQWENELERKKNQRKSITRSLSSVMNKIKGMYRIMKG